MTDTATTTEPRRRSGDFVSDAEIARRWGLSDKTARKAIKAYEKTGRFPQRERLCGQRRYWPAVERFMQDRFGMGAPAPLVPDGEEISYDDAKDRRRARIGSAPSR